MQAYGQQVERLQALQMLLGEGKGSSSSKVWKRTCR
jgi:hypothetical protein